MILSASVLYGFDLVARAPYPPVRPVESVPPSSGDDRPRPGLEIDGRPVDGAIASFAGAGMLLVAQEERDAPADPDGLTREEEARVGELKHRDADVRRHERAHAAAAGPYGGAPVFRFQRGPDGRMYAVGGEVGIDVSPEGDAARTIRKMEVVIAAALAPSNPSAQDRMVAAKAKQIMAQAQAELEAEKEQKLEEGSRRRLQRGAEPDGAGSLDVELAQALGAFQAATALSRPPAHRDPRAFQDLVV